MVRSGMSQSAAFGDEGREFVRSSRRQRAMARTSHLRDRISDLPDHLAHQILDFLPRKDAVRTSVLSKRWQSIWWTYPTHDFDESRFQHLNEGEARAEFVGAMMDGTTRQNGENPIVQNLRVLTVHPNDAFVQAFTRTYIELGLTESKLLDLDITFDSKYCYEHSETYPSAFLLPNSVFTSGTWLTSLNLHGCRCGPCENLSLPSLKKISLKYTSIDDKTLELLISNSPILKHLNIDFCFDISVLRVLNPSLSYLDVANAEDLSLLEMDVPGLRFFKYNGAFTMINHPAVGIAEQCSKILKFKSPNGAKGFKELKTVSISNLEMADTVLEAMFSSFKSLETVNLLCCAFGTIPFSLNAKLETINLDFCEFEKLLIDDQSLRNFSISSNIVVNAPIVREVSGNTFFILTSISLVGNVYFPNGCFHFVSGPHLESLVLRSCVGLKDIKLSSVSLKTLVIEFCLGLESGAIHAPLLQVLKYIGFVVDFFAMIVSDEVHVDLHLLKPNPLYLTSGLYENKLWFFLRLFQFAKVMTIQGDHQSIIIPSRLSHCPAIRYLEQLNVRTVLQGMSYLSFLMEVVNLSFCFKTVTLNIWTSEVELKFAVPLDMAHIMKYETNMLTYKHNCISQHLIEAKIENFEGNGNEMEVVAYLLGTATLLNSMTVFFKRGLAANATIALSETIKSFPTATNFVVFKFGRHI